MIRAASAPARRFGSGTRMLPFGPVPGRTGRPSTATLQSVAPPGSVSARKLRWLLRTARRASTSALPSSLTMAR